MSGRAGLLAVLIGAIAVAASPAELTVVSTPPGGTVFLDDRCLGVAPLTVQLDAEGPHLLRVEQRGCEPWRGTVELGAKPSRVEAQLVPAARGRIAVATEPAGAEVYVDGRPVGASPIATPDLPLSTHTVQVAKAGYVLAEQEVTLTARRPSVELKLTLTARVAEYLLARLEAHPDDIVAMTDLAHEHALQHRFDECLAMLGKACDAVADHAATLDQDDIRRVYQEVDRLYDKQFDYAPDETVAALKPRLLEALRAAIARRPANGETYESLGDLLAAAGDSAGALATYEEGAKLADQLPVRIRLLGSAGSLRYARGTAAEQAAKWADAVAAYRELAAAYPELWCAQNALLRICHLSGGQLKEPDQALEAARSLVERFPKSPSCPDILSAAASYLAAAGKSEEAAKAYEEVPGFYLPAPAGRAPPSQALHALLQAATLYEQTLKDPARALPVWGKLIQVGGTSDEAATARQHVAAILRAKGDAAGADRLVAEVLQAFPLSSAAVALQTDPQKKQAIDAARKGYVEAAQLHKDGKAADALARCERMMKEDGDNYFTCQAQQIAISLAAGELKDPAKVVELRLGLVDRWPSHPDSAQQLYQAGYVLEAQIDDLPRALQVYQRCVESYPQDEAAGLCLNRLGLIWMLKQSQIDYRKAMAAFLRVASEYPHSDNARVARKYAGDCQMQLRDTAKAREMFLQLMREDPNDYASYLAAASGYTWVRMRKDAP